MARTAKSLNVNEGPKLKAALDISICKGSTRPHLGRSPLPSIGDIIFMFPIYALLAFAPNSVFADGSTGWHLVSGQYIIDNFRVPHHDLISYTFPQKAWVPYEWLFDAVAAALVRLGDLRLLAVVTAASIGWLLLSIYGDVRRTGCHYLIAIGVVLIGALTSSVHWLARPHLFTFFGVYIFARFLEAFHRNTLSPRRAIAIFGLTMIVWSNAHPGFLTGFVMVTIYLASEVVTMIALPPGEERRLTRKRAGTLLASLAVMAAASLLTPNGLALYPYIGSYLSPGSSALMNAFEEFMSPTFHGEVHAGSLELLFFAIVIGLATSRRKPWLGQLLLVLAFAHLSLSGMRNEPLFAIVSVPFIAELFADNNLFALIGGPGTFSPRWLDPLRQRVRGMAQRFDAMESRCTMHLIPIVTTGILALSCIGAGMTPAVHSLVSSQFDLKTKPTTTLDYIQNKHLAWDRGFNLDNWGGYIRYKTGQRVFIDDRLDFYGPGFYLRYVQTISIQPGWSKLLDEYKIEWVLLRKDVLLATMLAQTPGWHLSAEDQAAYLFVRGPIAQHSLPHGVASARSNP